MDPIQGSKVDPVAVSGETVEQKIERFREEAAAELVRGIAGAEKKEGVTK